MILQKSVRNYSVSVTDIVMTTVLNRVCRNKILYILQQTNAGWSWSSNEVLCFASSCKWTEHRDL